MMPGNWFSTSTPGSDSREFVHNTSRGEQQPALGRGGGVGENGWPRGLPERGPSSLVPLALCMYLRYSGSVADALPPSSISLSPSESILSKGSLTVLHRRLPRHGSCLPRDVGLIKCGRSRLVLLLHCSPSRTSSCNCFLCSSTYFLCPRFPQILEAHYW